jgi:hypothetical protein
MLAQATPTAPRASDRHVDESLVRWMLSLTPIERLQVLQGFVDSLTELRRDQPPSVQRSP